MVSRNQIIGRKSSWQRTRPTARMLVGAIIIALIGLVGLTPKTIFGVQLIWPYAGLWGAVGWASAGLALRPMLLLCLFGIAQDVFFVGPIGNFMLVNLITYGVAATLGETLDVETDPVRALMVSAVSMGAGFAALWALASGTADHVVRLGPLLGTYLITLLLFIPLSGLFRLGGRPGEKAGVA